MTPTLLILLAALAGLLIGSFCNVVIHRLPRIIEQEWQQEFAAWQQEQGLTPVSPEAPLLSLSLPGSHCPCCRTPLRWWQLVPVLSWLMLRGRCTACRGRISIRYPLVELSVAGLAALCALQLGATPAAVVIFALMTLLLVSALVDWDSQWLPDRLTLPMLWLGLLATASDINPLPVTLDEAVWGAALGWGFLAGLAWVFRTLTGRDGLGGGDTKLVAALGAWLGPWALPDVLLAAALLGLLTALWQRLRHGLGGAFPFGPALALAGAGLVWLHLLQPLH